MNIKEYLEQLEQTKQTLLALNLPDTTPLVSEPIWGVMYNMEKSAVEFEAGKVFKYNNKYALYSCSPEPTETQMVVIVVSKSKQWE